MILIKNGTVIDPKSGLDGDYDLIIENGFIKDIGKPGSFGSIKFDQTIEARDRWIVPGLIDLHVHLREPGFEWKETILSGCEAAVLGGFTSVCCMPNTQPRNDSAEVTKFILEKASNAGAARVLPIGAVSVGLLGETMAPLSELQQAGCVAFSDDGEPVWNAGLMRRALEWALALDVPISCHEEDKSLSCGGCMNESPLSTRMGLRGMHGVAEDVMIARDIELARVTGAKVHICHISTARGAELVRRAKQDGFLVTAEVTPHHLVLTEESVIGYDTNSKMSPPLRDNNDRQALIEAVKDGTIDAVASDHAPHELDSKQVEFGKAAFGILGLQTTLPLLMGFVIDGTFSRTRAIELMSSGPAGAFGLSAGKLAKGAVADIAIIDPKAKWRFDHEAVRSLSFNSPFIDRELTGRAETVMVGGKVVVEGAKLVKSQR